MIASKEREAAALMNMVHGVFIDLVKQPGRDFTQRQLAVFLLVYGREEPLTVGALATSLHIAAPVMTRALDRLAGSRLIKRELDTEDRRRILVRRTEEGETFLREVRSLLCKAAQQAGILPKPLERQTKKRRGAKSMGNMRVPGNAGNGS